MLTAEVQEGIVRHGWTEIEGLLKSKLLFVSLLPLQQWLGPFKVHPNWGATQAQK